MKLRHSARTDVGRTRDHNEDNYGVGESADVETLGHLFVVCDGMGGHAAGEVASSLGVERIMSSYYEEAGADRAAILAQAFERANHWIHAEGRGSMGTTGVAALIYHNALHIANVGDSRAYLLRDGEITQISRDHSLVSDQVAAGLITSEQARSMHYRNVITRAIGYQADVTVDLFHLPLQQGDLIALSSDGLHGLIEDAEIAQVLSAAPLAQAVEQLVQLANDRGGTDNITLVAIAIDQLDGEQPDDEPFPLDHTVDPDTITQPNLRMNTALLPSSAEAPRAPEPSSVQAVGFPPPAALDPSARRQRERRLTIPGFLLAALLLVCLVGIVLLLPQTVVAPPTAPTSVTATTSPPSATPAATTTR